MNLREKKVLTSKERNELVSKYGPLEIRTIEATEDTPKITQLIDKSGFRTSHYMVQDLFEWKYGDKIAELPADEYVPVGPYYKITYVTSKGETPDPVEFRLVNGVHVLTKEDLPILQIIDWEVKSWTLDGKPVKVGDSIKGNVTLVAVWGRKEAGLNDYLFSDGTYSEELQEGKTPIAVGVLAGSQTPDGKPRWVSLKNMSAVDPENGTIAEGNDSETNDGCNFCWGANRLVRKYWESIPQYGWDAEKNDFYSDIQDLTNYMYTAIQNINPSSAFEEEFRKIDNELHLWIPTAEYEGDSYYNPCFLNNNGTLNQKLQVSVYDGESFTNAYTDFDGKGNTAAIMEVATKYLEGEIDRTDITEGSYPAATACYRYGIPNAVCDGVHFAEAHQWYLGALGEQIPIISRLSTINAKIAAAIDAGFDAVCIGDYSTQDSLGDWLWSSSESSESSAWDLSVYDGYSSNYDRGFRSTNTRVRAFLAFTPIS